MPFPSLFHLFSRLFPRDGKGRAVPLSDHFDGRRFFNPWDKTTRSIRDLIKWRMDGNSVPWPESLPNTRMDPPPERVHGNALRVTCIGHCTTLIQTGGANILTDPVFSGRTGPAGIGPRRARLPGIPLDKLPPVDLVLITHNHYDHLDLPSLAALWERHRPRVIAPLGDGPLIGRAAPGMRAEELDWWEGVDAAPGLRVHATPAHHWSARGLFDRRDALWCSFVIEAPCGLVSFFGDTGYGGGAPFRLVRERFGAPRLALLPIGAYEPRWFMAPAHMNPEEAVLAFEILGARHAAALHHGVFKLSDEGIGQSLTDLAEALVKHGVSPEAFRAPDVGEGWDVP